MQQLLQTFTEGMLHLLTEHDRLRGTRVSPAETFARLLEHFIS